MTKIAVVVALSDRAPGDLTESDIREDVELRLRRSGLLVSSSELAKATLVVSVVALPSESGEGRALSYSYWAEVELQREMIAGDHLLGKLTDEDSTLGIDPDEVQRVWNEEGPEAGLARLKDRRYPLRELEAVIFNPYLVHKVSHRVTVWDKGILGIVGVDRAPARKVRDQVEDLTAQLINAVLAANPKPSPD